MLHTRSPSLVSARPTSHSKGVVARLLARQAARACGSESLRAATNFMVLLLPFSHEAIASHAAGQHAETSQFVGHISQLSHPPRVDVAAPPQLPAVGMRPGSAHACGCVLGEPERTEELGQQVGRQQDIHAP
eukprot:scaffold57411_cov65-Phaeocystis_antarctica.AAC.8